jgi:signal transduction histidine kinase
MSTVKSIKLLILEHDENDLEMLLYELKKGALDFVSTIVETKDQFSCALVDFCPDIILSDYSLPGFDGVSAFKIKQEICPDVPFIIVSGTIGEENAVELIKNGVTDYALKDKLFTVIPKIKRAISEVSERREKAKYSEQLMRERVEHQRKLVRASIESQERERAEIGRELHDNINQILAVTKAYIEASVQEKDMQEELAQRSIRNLQLAINEIRKISKSLVPPVMDKNGFIDSVHDLIENIRLVNPFDINFTYEKEYLRNVSPQQQLALYRIVQEQFNNIIKHAQAHSVVIELSEKNNCIDLNIKDDGQGFDPKERRKGVGLSNILSRIELFDGKLEVISSKGQGCTLKIHVPKESRVVA